MELRGYTIRDIGGKVYRRLDRKDKYVYRDFIEVIGEKYKNKRVRDWIILFKLYISHYIRGSNLRIRYEKKGSYFSGRYKKGSGHYRWCISQRRRVNKWTKRREEEGEGAKVRDM